ncbi:VOC family protein [Novosphingobium sp.]|uniref:VOC family protein n=1 Tax=Novosphingobium sp. TaxID=1874826 RepID=UPI0038B9100D
MAVQGIGGYFFRANDPEALAAWYAEHLGMGLEWEQQAGPTVIQPFPADSAYFPLARQAMLNLRVDDLPGMIAKLEASGIAVARNPDWDGDYGSFARITDPEGNPIELWEPQSV